MDALYNPNTFLKLLYKWQETPGNTQTLLAELLHVSRQSINAYKRGVIPREDVINQMCEVFQVQKDIFFEKKSKERILYETEHKRFITWINGMKALYAKMGIIQVVKGELFFIDESGKKHDIDKITFDNMLSSLYDMSENLLNICIAPDPAKKRHRLSKDPDEIF